MNIKAKSVLSSPGDAWDPASGASFETSTTQNRDGDFVDCWPDDWEYDADGWNVSGFDTEDDADADGDNNNNKWYSFVENKTPLSETVTAIDPFLDPTSPGAATAWDSTSSPWKPPDTTPLFKNTAAEDEEASTMASVLSGMTPTAASKKKLRPSPVSKIKKLFCKPSKGLPLVDDLKETDVFLKNPSPGDRRLPTPTQELLADRTTNKAGRTTKSLRVATTSFEKSPSEVAASNGSVTSFPFDESPTGRGLNSESPQKSQDDNEKEGEATKAATVGEVNPLEVVKLAECCSDATPSPAAGAAAPPRTRGTFHQTDLLFFRDADQAPTIANLNKWCGVVRAPQDLFQYNGTEESPLSSPSDASETVASSALRGCVLDPNLASVLHLDATSPLGLTRKKLFATTSEENLNAGGGGGEDERSTHTDGVRQTIVTFASKDEIFGEDEEGEDENPTVQEEDVKAKEASREDSGSSLSIGDIIDESRQEKEDSRLQQLDQDAATVDSTSSEETPSTSEERRYRGRPYLPSGLMEVKELLQETDGVVSHHVDSPTPHVLIPSSGSAFSKLEELAQQATVTEATVTTTTSRREALTRRTSVKQETKQQAPSKLTLRTALIDSFEAREPGAPSAPDVPVTTTATEEAAAPDSDSPVPPETIKVEECKSFSSEVSDLSFLSESVASSTKQQQQQHQPTKSRVAARRKWLQSQAFGNKNKLDEHEEILSSVAGADDASSQQGSVSSVAEKFGGTTASVSRKSAVQRRRQEWESKFVTKSSERGLMTKPTRKTRWESNGGKFKKKVVIEDARE